MPTSVMAYSVVPSSVVPSSIVLVSVVPSSGMRSSVMALPVAALPAHQDVSVRQARVGSVTHGEHPGVSRVLGSRVALAPWILLVSTQSSRG